MILIKLVKHVKTSAHLPVHKCTHIHTHTYTYTHLYYNNERLDIF